MRSGAPGDRGLNARGYRLGEASRVRRNLAIGAGALLLR